MFIEFLLQFIHVILNFKQLKKNIVLKCGTSLRYTIARPSRSEDGFEDRFGQQ
jgi:hypothetical protein